VFDAVRLNVADAAEQKRLVARAGELASTWDELLPARRRGIVCTLIGRIDVKADRVAIQMLPSRMAPILNDAPAATPLSDTDERITLQVPVQLQRVGLGTKMIVPGPNRPTVRPDPGMITLLAKAHRLQQKVLSSARTGIGEIAEEAGLSGSYFTRLLRLAWLAPDITQAILEGRHPPALTAIKLMGKALPPDWDGQRTALGFT